MKNLGLLLLAAAISSVTFAGEVTIPHTFSSGTTAKASDVNGNFAAIKTAVDDNNNRITTIKSQTDANTASIDNNTTAINVHTTNITAIQSDITDLSANISNVASNTASIISLDTRLTDAETGLSTVSNSLNNAELEVEGNTANIASLTTRVTDAELNIQQNSADIDANESALAAIVGGIRVFSNGIPIGAYLRSSGGDSTVIAPAEIFVLSSKGYIFWVNISGGLAGSLSGEANTIVFETTDCTGQGYIDAGLALTSEYSRNQGLLIRTETSLTTWYLPKGTSNSVLITPSSKRDNHGCTSETGARDTYAVEVNDPSITGVTFDPLGPITLGF